MLKALSIFSKIFDLGSRMIRLLFYLDPRVKPEDDNRKKVPEDDNKRKKAKLSMTMKRKMSKRSVHRST